MINISHVNKYEQSVSKSNFLTLVMVYLLLVLAILTNSCNTYVLAVDDNGMDLPLEISEKYYKKDSILKFNQAVGKWGQRDVKKESVDEAIILWSEAVSVDPNLWVAYLGLGQAYDLKKEYKKSLEAYNNYLTLAPKEAPDKKTVIESVEYLTHLLKHGEEALVSEDYLNLVKTKHQGKETYVRWDLSKPIKIYFFPAYGIPSYKEEFQVAFLQGAKMWQEVLPSFKLEILDNTEVASLPVKKADQKEKEILEQAQIKVVFPSKFKIKGDPNNPVAQEIDAQSFPIIRDKKNFRVLGIIMISPYVYYQSQIAIPLEPLLKLKPNEQINKLKIIAAREIGHALGLWGFSPNPDDLMFEGEVTQFKLSERDKNTMKKLYELNPGTEDLITNQELHK